MECNLIMVTDGYIHRILSYAIASQSPGPNGPRVLWSRVDIGSRSTEIEANNVGRPGIVIQFE
jgi:hypothetical protein